MRPRISQALFPRRLSFLPVASFLISNWCFLFFLSNESSSRYLISFPGYFSYTYTPVEQTQDQESIIPSVLHSPEVFKLNYVEMERRFKIFVYPDGKKRYYHTPRSLSGKYTSEGYFFKNMKESGFLTKDPEKAHLFFIPISCQHIRRQGLSYEKITGTVQEYVESLIVKYPFWNRTLGADHFFVTCQEIGLRATVGVPQLVYNSIRVVCAPRDDDGYIRHKDFVLPDEIQPSAFPVATFETFNRTALGFYPGNNSKSESRRELFITWQNDRELDIQSNRATGKYPQLEKFNNAKFCICPGGTYVHGSHIALSVQHGCVPVILLDDHHDLPFNDILDWRKFSIILKGDDVLRLKSILKRISYGQFRFLHYNAVQVQRHLQWNSPPINYDAFHLVMYQLWLRRHVSKY